MICQNCKAQYTGNRCPVCGAYTLEPAPYVALECPRCHSHNVSVQLTNMVTIKNKHHSVFWWIFVGWWWLPIKWLVFTVPALIFKIFGHRPQRAVNVQRKTCVCQSCGESWDIK